MPIPLGIFATAGAGGAGGSAFELISTQVLTSSAASVTFSSIPATYKHLQIRMVTKTGAAFTDQWAFMQMNSDTGSNYAYHRIQGNGGSVFSNSGTSRTNMIVSLQSTSRDSNLGWSVAIADLLDYSSASKNTTMRSLTGMVDAANLIGLYSGLWMNTATVSSLNLFPESGSWLTGSRFSLYGIKG